MLYDLLVFANHIIGYINIGTGEIEALTISSTMITRSSRIGIK